MVRDVFFIFLLFFPFTLTEDLQDIAFIKPIIIREKYDTTIDITMNNYVGINERYLMKYIAKDADLNTAVKLICTNDLNVRTKLITCKINVGTPKDYELIYNEKKNTGKVFTVMRQVVVPSSNKNKGLINIPLNIPLNMILQRIQEDVVNFKYVTESASDVGGAKPAVCDGNGKIITCKIVESNPGLYKMVFNNKIINESFELGDQSIIEMKTTADLTEGYGTSEIIFIMSKAVNSENLEKLKYGPWPGITVTNAKDLKCKKSLETTITCTPFTVDSGMFEVIFYDYRTSRLFNVIPSPGLKIIGVNTKFVRAENNQLSTIEINFRMGDSVQNYEQIRAIDVNDANNIILIHPNTDGNCDNNGGSPIFKCTFKTDDINNGKTFSLEYDGKQTDQTFTFKPQEIISIDQIIIEPNQQSRIVLTLDLEKVKNDINVVKYALQSETNIENFELLTCSNSEIVPKVISCLINAGDLSKKYQLAFGSVIYKTQLIRVENQALASVKNEILDSRIGLIRLYMRCPPRNEHATMFKYKKEKSSDNTLHQMKSCSNDASFISCRLTNLEPGDYEIYFDDKLSPFKFFVQAFTNPEAEINRGQYQSLSLLSLFILFFITF